MPRPPAPDARPSARSAVKHLPPVAAGATPPRPRIPRGESLHSPAGMLHLLLSKASPLLRQPPHTQDAAASVAHAAVESQRAKVAEVRDRLKLAYEDERERKSTQARLTALQQELDRRERVAKQTSEAAAYARTQLTMHKNAAVAFALEQQRAAERKQKVPEGGLCACLFCAALPAAAAASVVCYGCAHGRPMCS